MSASDEARQNGSAGGGIGRPLRDGIDVARTQVSDAVASARSSVHDAGGTIEAYPIATLVGGVALGVVIGALLPRTERETELLGSIGRRLQDGARGAASAAREAGQQKFSELGLDRDHARESARGLVDNLLAAAAAAGTAALQSARNTRG